MWNFHYMTNDAMKGIISSACDRLNCKGLRKLLELAFMGDNIRFVTFIDAAFESDLLESVLGSFNDQSSVIIDERVYENMKLIHKIENTFSIAEVFRSSIFFICKYLIDYGLDAWFLFLDDLLEKFNDVEEVKVKDYLKNKSIFLRENIHMLINALGKNQKIAFFDYSGVFLYNLRI